jgi:hypothetical protein
MNNKVKFRARRLKIVFYEGAEVDEVLGTVVRRGVDGPAGEARYWIVETPPTVFVKGLPIAQFLIIGPGGREGRLEVLDDPGFKGVACQMLLDRTGKAPDIDRFDFQTAYDFGRGMAEIVD